MKLLNYLEYLLNWLFNPKILEAINTGATYEEVERIAKGE
jgi:hypothetical protein